MKKRRNEIKKSDIFSHWVNIDYLPRWGVLLLDLLIVLFAFVISTFIGENVVGYDFTNVEAFHNVIFYPCCCRVKTRTDNRRL